LLALQLAEMARHLSSGIPFDLVEAGAGNGRLAADLLQTLARDDRELFERTRVHLVESSAAARAAQATTLGPLAVRLASSSDSLPERFDGVLVANELLDALPVHQVVMHGTELREVYVIAGTDGLATVEGPPSTPALAEYFSDLGVTLEDGWRVEVNLAARGWIADVASRLQRGFVIVIDYGYHAQQLYSATRADGTLTTFRRHVMTSAEDVRGPAWLAAAGEQDMTTHVDFTTLQRAAEHAGLVPLGLLDQTYFLMSLIDGLSLDTGGTSTPALKRRLALKTLLMPGGLGSTMKVLILGKGVGRPRLKGCSYRARLT
jgi:SAM-dependent MidA family methyltransferase